MTLDRLPKYLWTVTYKTRRPQSRVFTTRQEARDFVKSKTVSGMSRDMFTIQSHTVVTKTQ